MECVVFDKSGPYFYVGGPSRAKTFSLLCLNIPVFNSRVEESAVGKTIARYGTLLIPCLAVDLAALVRQRETTSES